MTYGSNPIGYLFRQSRPNIRQLTCVVVLVGVVVI